jgi:hypothetical protein
LTKHFCRSCRLTFPRKIEYGLSRLESNKEANLPDSIEFSRARATILHVDALALDSETRENTSRLSRFPLQPQFLLIGVQLVEALVIVEQGGFSSSVPCPETW